MEEEKREKRGSIAFFSTYRPPVPLDIFSCPLPPTTRQDELRMTDGKSYNYSGRDIPPAALLTLLDYTSWASSDNEADVNSGRLSGMIFVSERGDLELLHIALRFDDNDNPPKVEVFSLADIFGTSDFDGVRMEDSGCIALDHLIYISTKEPATKRRQPWTAVYRTNLNTRKTDRLTPKEHADLSPSVSPSGKMIAVASFEGKMGEKMEHVGWAGELEDLKTDIYVMNVEEPFDRRLVVKNGGWPTWGSDDVIFFHRKDDNKKKKQDDKVDTTEEITNYWGVYRADISSGDVMPERVTPDNIDAFTPAAIDATTVAVATIRQKSKVIHLSEVRQIAQYRHIEIFCSTRGQEPKQITQEIKPKADHFNPFVIGGGKRIGYHRCTSDTLDDEEEIKRQFHVVNSPDPDIGLFRVGGGFPSFSKDGTKLAFVDNEFKTVYVLHNERLHVANKQTSKSIFAPVWNQHDKMDTLYVCEGPAFSADETVNILAIPNVSSGTPTEPKPLTDGFNNAFPSTNPAGTKIVYRSTRDGYKNLYIMDAQKGVLNGEKPKRLTEGNWTDTQCQWSPRGNWIVFSSSRDKPSSAPKKDHNLDPGFFGVYLVNPDDPAVWVRVIASGYDLGGHVNHPFFSPDGFSIVVVSDLAAVSVDPVSLPMFIHSARPYGDIFTFDLIDQEDIKENRVTTFKRITHSRYENSTGTWTSFSPRDTRAARNILKGNEFKRVLHPCPHIANGKDESWHMTGHRVSEKRC